MYWLKNIFYPHTFLRYIFYNKYNYEQSLIPKEVLWHEEAHVKQRHSIDILFIELLQVFLWFNPIIYFTKSAIKLNHEFLADEGVLNKGIVPSTYQHTLLSFTSSTSEYNLVSGIHYSSIKKRFKIMKTKTPKHIALFKSLLVLPLLAITLYSFSSKAVIEINQNPTRLNGEKAASAHTMTIDKATPEQIAEYTKLVNYYSTHTEVDFLKHLKDMSRIKALYDIMTDTQKKTVKKYPQFPPSLDIFIGDNGKFYIDDKLVSESEIKTLLANFSSKELSNTYVFKEAKDFERYRMKPGQIRSIDDTYIFLYAKNPVFEDDLFHKSESFKSFKRVQIASKHPKIKTFTSTLAKLIKDSGVKHISL